MLETINSTRTLSATVLHRVHASKIGANDAAQTFQSQLAENAEGFALFSTPRRCILGKVNHNSIADRNGNRISPDCGYEIRMWSADTELRWLQDGPDTGSAVMLAETPFVGIDTPWVAADGIPAERLDGLHYLIWGTCHRTEDDWAVMSDARINELHIPIAGLPINARCAVSALEYLATVDDDGNVGVIEERLTGIRTLQKREG